MENKFFEVSRHAFCMKHVNFVESEKQFQRLGQISTDDSQYDALRVVYEELIAMHSLTKRQNQVFEEIIRSLVYDSECPSSILSGIDFSFSEEEGVIMHRRSANGISFIAIDEEGDSMFSFSSYSSRDKGRRMFFDYGSGSEEAMAYRLLAE